MADEGTRADRDTGADRMRSDRPGQTRSDEDRGDRTSFNRPDQRQGVTERMLSLTIIGHLHRLLMGSTRGQRLVGVLTTSPKVGLITKPTNTVRDQMPGIESVERSRLRNRTAEMSNQTTILINTCLPAGIVKRPDVLIANATPVTLSAKVVN